MNNEALKKELYSSVTSKPYSAFKDGLCHWGILGMHWGIRRYQNKDGTLTEAGKKRRQKLRNELGELEKNDKKKKKKDKTKSTSKSIKNMTDAELAEKTRRAQAEKAYEQAMLSRNSRDNAKKYKSVKELSDDELSSLIKRLENEDKFNAYKKSHRKLTPGEWFIETAGEALKDETKNAIKDVASTGRKALTGVVDTFGMEIKKDVISDIKKDFDESRKKDELLDKLKKEAKSRGEE